MSARSLEDSSNIRDGNDAEIAGKSWGQSFEEGLSFLCLNEAFFFVFDSGAVMLEVNAGVDVEDFFELSPNVFLRDFVWDLSTETVAAEGSEWGGCCL